MGTKSPNRRNNRYPFQRALLAQFESVAADRCTKHAAISYILSGNQMTAPVPPGTSYKDEIQIIAKKAAVPFPIDFISQELDTRGTSQKGNTLTGGVSSRLDLIASNFENIRWWVNDRGLTIDRIDRRSSLSDFERTAGELMITHSTGGRLADGGLESIARALDEAKIPLKQSLQAGFLKSLNKHNSGPPTKAIKTFIQAVENRHAGIRRGVQKALYAAKTKYSKTIAS